MCVGRGQDTPQLCGHAKERNQEGAGGQLGTKQKPAPRSPSLPWVTCETFLTHPQLPWASWAVVPGVQSGLFTLEMCCPRSRFNPAGFRVTWFPVGGCA